MQYPPSPCNGSHCEGGVVCQEGGTSLGYGAHYRVVVIMGWSMPPSKVVDEKNPTPILREIVYQNSHH